MAPSKHESSKERKRANSYMIWTRMKRTCQWKGRISVCDSMNGDIFGFFNCHVPTRGDQVCLSLSNTCVFENSCVADELWRPTPVRKRSQLGAWDCVAFRKCGFKSNFTCREACRACGRARASKGASPTLSKLVTWCAYPGISFQI